jgi:uncharacterized membrane protein
VIPSSSTPAWGVSLAYWLHMLATVVWIGGLSSLALLALPAASRMMDGAAYAAFLGEIQRRLEPVGWFSLAVLTATGLIQMSASPNYQGFLTISNGWAGAILIKHLVIIGMVGVSAVMTWGVLPGLRRATLRLGKNSSQGDLTDPERLQQVLHASQTSTRLIRINLVLSIIVLALTAIARAA